MDALSAHQALSDPSRLAIAQALLTHDLSPREIGERWALSTPLVAHHLKVLDQAGLVRRRVGEHDARRSYVSLRHDDADVVAVVAVGAPRVPQPRRIAFVCTANSARSKLAAALWRRVSPLPVIDAGTEPARAPHPRTVKVAERLDLPVDPEMHRMVDVLLPDDLVIAVCDHVHETLGADATRWHWSIPDPVPAGADTFEEVCVTLDQRVHDLESSMA